MIRKKSEAYKLIKDNIGKLAIIQEVTQYSPTRLVNFFLNFQARQDHSPFDLLIAHEEQQYNPLSDKSAYKYFNKHLNEYLNLHKNSQAYALMIEVLQKDFLCADYFGMSYQDLANTYRQKEQWVKAFVKEAYKAMYPITPDMTPSQVGARNQKIGKVSVRSYIGDLVDYSYFKEAPSFMMADVELALSSIDLFICRLLSDRTLDQQFKKLKTNNNLDLKLPPKNSQKPKISKI